MCVYLQLLEDKRNNNDKSSLTSSRKKVYIWTSRVETLGKDTQAPDVEDDMRGERRGITAASKALLDQVNVTNMGEEGHNLLMKIQGCATTEDMAKIQKHLVQMHCAQEVVTTLLTAGLRGSLFSVQPAVRPLLGLGLTDSALVPPTSAGAPRVASSLLSP